MARKELNWKEKTSKRDIPIAIKLLAVIAGIVIFGTIGATIITLNIFDRGITNDVKNSLEYTSKGVQTTFTDWQTSLTAYTKMIAMNSELQEGLEDDDSGAIQSVLSETKKNIFIGFIAVTDTTGTVVSGGGVNIRTGANLRSLYTVSSALQGRSATAFDGIDSFDYALYASSPIESDGRVIGSVTMGVDLVGNSDYNTVNTIKNSYNVDSTIFKGNTRLASTVNGVVGSTLSDQEVARQVFQQGGIFKDFTTIQGQKYYAIYWPLKSGDTITGMCFIAKSMAVIQSVTQDSVKIVFPVMFIIVLVLILLAFRFIKWLMWRIKNVTDFLTELESGEADLTKRSKLFIRDEIGDLVIHFNLFLEKLHEIISALKESKATLHDSGKKMFESSNETVNAMNDITNTITGVSRQIAEQGQSVETTAGAVADISTNIEQLDNMIDSQASSVTQASAAVEQMIGNISSVNQSVDKMVSSFDELAANAQTGFTKQQDVNERIKQIETQSAMLQEANQAISNIAEQTNLLAMNAAIEAAHAGEAGKGFSVVADEIRKLSETSSSQSKSIGDQLNKIKDSISEVVAASTESSEAFTAVSAKIKQTDELVLQIKAAMEEQTSGSRQISDALKSMNDSTVEVHNSSKEMSGRNERISREMSSLQNVTASMEQGMEDMSSGAKTIAATSSSLGGIAEEVRVSIEKIGEQIDLFKV